MVHLDRLVSTIPTGVEGMILVFLLVSGLVLWLLVPFMIYSLCSRIKTIEWNINYILFGDKERNVRNIKGDNRDNIVYWILAIVEQRQRERLKREQRTPAKVLPVDTRKTDFRSSSR